MEVRRHLKRQILSFSRQVDSWMLGPRYVAKRLKPAIANAMAMRTGTDSIPTHVINLESRPDRLSETATELAKMGITHWSRFEAVKESNGALGCALSHARLVEQLQGAQPAVMVCEDDIEFLVSPDALHDVVSEFLRNPALDVLCLAFHLRSQPHRISSSLAITADTATASCYVAKTHSLEMLRDSFFEAAQLIEEGKPMGLAAIDQHWKKLQRRELIFAVPRVRAVRQRASFSDIEGHEVFYGV